MIVVIVNLIGPSQEVVTTAMLDASSTTSQRVRSVYRSLLRTRFFPIVSAAEESTECVASKGKVVVGGGTGFVGGEVCALLQRKGYQVIVVSR